MSTQSESKYRPVNVMLGQQPRFGPIPSEQLIPWAMISFALFFVCKRLLQLEWTWTILLIFWGNATWWLLTGSNPWRFLSKFVRTPTWIRGRVQYRSILHSMAESIKSSSKKQKSTARKKVVSTNQKKRHPSS